MGEDKDEEPNGGCGICGPCRLACFRKDDGVRKRQFRQYDWWNVYNASRHKKTGMMREMAAVNIDLSNGDLRGACKRYVIARRIQNNQHDPFESLHFEWRADR
jgi:hypothetical protein